MLKSSKQNPKVENRLKYRGSYYRPSQYDPKIKQSDIIQKNFMKNSDVQGYKIYDNFKDSQNVSKNIFKTNFSTRQSPDKIKFSYQALKQCLNKGTARKNFNQIIQRNSSKTHFKAIPISSPQTSYTQKKIPTFLATKTQND